MALCKVVILNWNGAGVLPRFLPSVVTATPAVTEICSQRVKVDIVVADNGSTDGSTDLLRRDFPSVGLIELDRNYGFAEGYNRALTQIEADYCILLNNDVETPDGWCEPLLETLVSDPAVAAVAPKILSYDRRDTFEYAGASGGFIDTLGYPFCRGRILGTVERDEKQYDDRRRVFWATGACFACRAAVFHATGGFDASFFAHQEEIDLCWRMQSAGWRIMVDPRSTVYHLGAGTLPPSPQKLYLNYRNNLAMLYKNLPSGRMQRIVALRIALDTLSALVWLLRGRPRNAAAVVRAHKDFRLMKRESLTAARRQIQSSRIARPEGIYRGSILLSYLFGRRRFNKL